jgi:hypothetical protein
MQRLLGVGIVLMWATAMAALFVRDVWPSWTAQDAPPMTRAQLGRLAREQQVGIFDAQDRRVGTAWSDISAKGDNPAIQGTVYVENLSILPRILVESLTEFDDQGELDSFNLEVFGVPLTNIRIHGERHGIYFPCELQLGPVFRQANLDASASRLIGDALRPFNYLPTLKVGQSWRMQVVDPMAAATTGKTQFTSVVARVTGKATLERDGKTLECFIVDTSPGQAKAWVGPDGRVYEQQVQLPGLGRLSVRDEPYSSKERERCRMRVRRSSDRAGVGGGTGSQPADHRPVEQLQQAIGKVLGGTL